MELPDRGAVFSSPAIGRDGTIYIGSCDGYLYAFGTPTTSPPPNPYLDDTDPPVIICPGDKVVSTTNSQIEVFYEAKVIDATDPAPQLTYSYEPGSQFPLGTTEVEVTAIDSSGNFSTCTFKVIVVKDDSGPSDNYPPGSDSSNNDPSSNDPSLRGPFNSENGCFINSLHISTIFNKFLYSRRPQTK